MNLLVFDFGGTSIKYGICAQEELIEVDSFPTPTSWEALVPQLVKIKEAFAKQYALEGVAFSFPGAVDSQSGAIYGISAIDYIHDFPIRAELEQLLKLPISMANDANCAALAELWKGAAKDIDHALFVVIGTGVGGVIIVDRKLHLGKHFFGGEFGIMQLEPGLSFSMVGTAVGMANRYCQRLNLPTGSISGKEVFELAKTGDALAAEEVETFYKYTALGLYNLQVAFDPDKIIIGGGLSANDEVIGILNSRVNELIAENKIGDIQAHIIGCHYQNHANLIGAAKQFYDEMQ